MSLIELIAEFRSAKANGDPAKYVHVISVEKAHATADQLEAMQAEIERLREALTPSAETKAAYIGEFSFCVEIGVDRPPIQPAVPWTTIKEIMAAIRTRASLQIKGVDQDPGAT